MYKLTKKRLFRTFAFVSAILLALVAILPMNNATAASDVVVNLNQTYQSMKGFGGMNHPVWISDLTDAQRNTAYGNSAGQLGLSILRIHVDENKNNWSKELATAKAAASKGAIIFATPWNPPASMTEKITKNGKQTQRLKTSQYGAYAQYLNDFVTYMKNNGVDLYAISIQNEPDWGYEWTWWEPDEIYNFTKNYAGKINCRVMSAESFSYNKSYYDKILNDPQALNNIDILGTHFYGTQPSAMAYPLFKQKGQGKELWMTEVYVPNSTDDADKWPGALDVSTNIHNAMQNGFQSYVWWYIRRSYGLIKENGQVSKRGYCMAQYSKFVRPGYVRVGATTNPQSNVAVSAFKGDGKAVVVIINNGSSEVNQNFTVTGDNVKSVERYRTSSSENLAKTNISVSNNKVNINLPAKSVTTLVYTLGNGPTATPTNVPTQGPTTKPIVTLKDGWYYIKNVNAQKYLQVTNNVGKAGQNIELGTGTGVGGQKWYLKNVGDGYFTLKTSLGEYMADVANGEDKDGANVGLYNAYSGAAQQFAAMASSTNGAYIVGTKASNLTKVLDDYEFSKEDGANVCQWTYGGKANQQWVFEEIKTSTASTVAPTQTPVQTPKPSDSTNVGDLKLDYTINNWGGGYQVDFKVINNTSAKVDTWTLTLKKSEINIGSSWNVTVKESGDYYVITPVDFNASIEKGSSIEFGVQGTGSIATSLSYTLK